MAAMTVTTLANVRWWSISPRTVEQNFRVFDKGLHVRI
jgi:hypothetical protein